MSRRIKYDVILDKLRERDLGEQPLSSVLLYGNQTNGSDIVVSTSDIITSLSGITLNIQSGMSGELNLYAGSGLSVAGDVYVGAGDNVLAPGGSIYIDAGSSINNDGGHVFINGGDAVLSGQTDGDIYLNNFRWPQADGLVGYGIVTDGNKILSFQRTVTAAEENIIIQSTLTDLVGAVPLESSNTVKWLVTAINTTLNTQTVYEVLGAQINNIPRHSISNIIFRDVSITTNAIISGLYFGLSITNNELNDVHISYVRLA